MTRPKPFSLSYVLGVTIDREIAAVEYSLNKVLERAREPALDPEMSREMFRTIQALITRRHRLQSEKASFQ